MPSQDLEIISRFPNIFDLSGDVTRSSMHWGFQMGPGWLGIMERLCERLVVIVEHPSAQIISVKSKWGSLRISYRGGGDAFEYEVEVAKAQSRAVCETCGAARKDYEGGFGGRQM